MDKQAKLQQAAKIINQELAEKTTFCFFVSPSVRTLKWFARYEGERLHKGSKGAGHSISRTEAREKLIRFGINLDQMLAQVGLS